MSNTLISGNATGVRGIRALEARLPPKWRLTTTWVEPVKSGYQSDLLVSLRAPDGTTGRLAVEAKRAVSAATATTLAPALREFANRKRATPLVIAGYLSPLARARLTDAGICYLDLTGNIQIAVDRPGLLIQASGAERDPSPVERGIRSLKGPKAARIVRALCDWKPPLGVRELAARTETNPGYVARVLALLERENVVGRDAKGSVASVEWQDLLRTWTRDYGVTSNNRAQLFIEVRSTAALIERIQRTKMKYAITGSRAVPPAAAVAPPRLISCYVQSIELAAEEFALQPAEDSGNVMLLEPFDDVAWQRTRTTGSLTLVAVSQCAADLLTGSAREPAEGEALLRWMEKNESDWRA